MPEKIHHCEYCGEETEDLAENFAINNEVNDDDDSIGFVIRSAVDWESVSKVLNIALQSHPFYRPTKIKLVP